MVFYESYVVLSKCLSTCTISPVSSFSFTKVCGYIKKHPFTGQRTKCTEVGEGEVGGVQTLKNVTIWGRKALNGFSACLTGELGLIYNKTP